jgi:hypothetical protein
VRIRIQEAKPIRIQTWILVRNKSLKKLNVNKHTYDYEGTKVFLNGRKPGYLLVSFNSMLLDPDPHCQHGSGSKTAKLMWIRIHNMAFWMIF